MDASTGDGGTCYGDSGGPDFLGTSDVVAAITITGDAVRRATNVVYRLDTVSARAFLDDDVTLPWSGAHRGTRPQPFCSGGYGR